MSVKKGDVYHSPHPPPDTGEPKGAATAKDSGAQQEASAFERQVGGTHYSDMAIQPVEFIHRNGIGFCEGAAIKYLSRWRGKGGVEDLRKAIHFIEMLIELETNDGV